MTGRRRQEGTAVIPGNLHVAEDCRAVSEVLARVGDKWTILVVSELGSGAKRFNEIRRALGSISQRMLTLTLRGLERDGLVTRTVFPTIPPKVEYELTRLGRSLLEPVSGIGLWARQNRSAIEEARKRFDTAADGGPGAPRRAGATGSPRCASGPNLSQPGSTCSSIAQATSRLTF